MKISKASVDYLDGPRLVRMLGAGIHHLFQRRDYINRINVFPVPDRDTGTNMAFTFKTILDAIKGRGELPLDEVMNLVTEAALDGARGNSGAIMAQYFQGVRESVAGAGRINAAGLARACQRGAQQAWTAMSEPVQGTLPTVLEDFAKALTHWVGEGIEDIGELFRRGLEKARESLANTPNQLPVLKHAGVVDAGGQGFVDLLEGILVYIESGAIDPLDKDMRDLDELIFEPGPDMGEMDIGDHRFCTECVIDGEGLDRRAVMRALQQLDSSSMVVAGSPERVRVHIHVNNPAEVFLACEQFGEIAQQKADDMQRQHSLLNQQGKVAVVVDSGADLPAGEVDRLGINIVPVRLSFGDREFLDGVSMSPDEFYRMLEESEVAPLTSQPPAKDFRRIYTLLTSHGYDVLSVGLSGSLSGTTQAARSAAELVKEGRVQVFDTLNASCGQGLLTMVAAEAAANGRSLEEIVALLRELTPMTHTVAAPDELTSAVRGGRVPPWLKSIASVLRITPILVAKKGRMGIGGVIFRRGVDAGALARYILRRMKKDTIYRVLVAHAANPDGARQVRQAILEKHPMVHSCHLAEAGPALGVHLGKGGLIVGFLPQPETLS